MATIFADGVNNIRSRNLNKGKYCLKLQMNRSHLNFHSPFMENQGAPQDPIMTHSIKYVLDVDM